MLYVTFVASNDFSQEYLEDLNLFTKHFADSQSLVLNYESELNLLISKLFGDTVINWIELNKGVFKKYSDVSSHQLPVLNGKLYDDCYEEWIRDSERENTMDEYGSLIFLQGLSAEWNTRKNRFILIENRA